MLRPICILPVVWFSTAASAQVLESEVFSTIRDLNFEVSYDTRVEDGDTVRFENVVLLNPEEGIGISFDWLAERVSGETSEITVSPEAALFNRTAGGDTTVAQLGLTGVVSTVTGVVGNRDIRFEGEAVTATLAAFGELATGLLSVNGIDIQSSVADQDVVTSNTTARIDQVSLALSGRGAEWETVSFRVNDIDLVQAGTMSQALSDQMQSDTKVEDVDRILEMLEATFSGQATIGTATLFVHGTDPQGNPIDVNAKLSGYDGRTKLATEPDANLGMGATLGEVSVSVLSDPAQFEIDVADYAIAFDMSLGADDVRNLIERIVQGEEPEPTDFSTLQIEARISAGEAETSGRFEEEDLAGSFSLVSAAGSERITFSDGVFDMDIESGGFAATGLIPFVSEEELSISSEGIGMQFQMPLIPSADGQDQNLAIRMAAQELLAGDAIWNLFDPEARIDREPVNVDIDVAMTGKLLEPLTEESQELFDVFDPSAVEIRSYSISGGGARVEASGESSLSLQDGFPVGEGSFFVTLKGVTTLVGHLVDLGIAPPEANIGVLGGLGAFANQVQPDHYEAEIEVFPDGRITTNGRPVPLGR